MHQYTAICKSTVKSKWENSELFVAVKEVSHLQIIDGALKSAGLENQVYSWLNMLKSIKGRNNKDSY